MCSLKHCDTNFTIHSGASKLTEKNKQMSPLKYAPVSKPQISPMFFCRHFINSARRHGKLPYHGAKQNEIQHETLVTTVGAAYLASARPHPDQADRWFLIVSV